MAKNQDLLKYRCYGLHGTTVFLLHGGPGAAGYMAPMAQAMEDSFRVVEPFQRRSRPGEVLTVARHVKDLADLIRAECSNGPPAVVGHSWGAMLALAFAAAHPELAGPLVLIGCGSFDPAAREQIRQIRQQRMSPPMRERIAKLSQQVKDQDKRLAVLGRLMREVDSCDLVPEPQQGLEFDAAGHEQTWADMIRLQEAGVYPAAFAAIRQPVLMLHGACDPHPGRMIFESLRPYLPRLEYRQWERCGHYPWLERAVREDFIAALKAWLRLKV